MSMLAGTGKGLLMRVGVGVLVLGRHLFLFHTVSLCIMGGCLLFYHRMSISDESWTISLRVVKDEKVLEYGRLPDINTRSCQVPSPPLQINNLDRVPELSRVALHEGSIDQEAAAGVSAGPQHQPLEDDGVDAVDDDLGRIYPAAVGK